MTGDWAVHQSEEWDVLGPFPIHAREQHFLSPSYPVDLTQPIDYGKGWPSAYADGGMVYWTKASSTTVGDLKVSFIDVRWDKLRATEGWAAFQHHTVLHTKLHVMPRHPPPLEPSRLQLGIQLKQGSYFCIMPPAAELGNQPRKNFAPRWYSGNIYDLPNSLPRIVDLPSHPSKDSVTIYDVFISGDYEIRLFGDPSSYNSRYPILSIKFSVITMPPPGVDLEPTQGVICDFVEGYAFGNTIGVGIRSRDTWWDVVSVSSIEGEPSESFTFTLEREIKLAPNQIRIVPIRLTQLKSFDGDKFLFNLFLRPKNGSEIHSLQCSVFVNHRPKWSEEGHPVIRASFLYAGTMPTSFLCVPPKQPTGGCYSNTIIALHGAGVEIDDPESFWPLAVPRQTYSWVIFPPGRTSWGLDWHGPSAKEALQSFSALSSILLNLHSKSKAEIAWDEYAISESSKLVVIGHSNGGQGTWYMSSRYPDEVIAAMPAASYVKSQAYVPLTMSRSAHFIDPALRAILESSLTPDDNDIFASNLTDTKILAIHGGDDENVPTWHTRTLVDAVKTWQSDADVTFKEDPGRPHWYPVFKQKSVQDFLDVVLELRKKPRSKSFTLTSVLPSASGSMHGWRIKEALIPGRVARINVKQEQDGSVNADLLNVSVFSIDTKVYELSELNVNGVSCPLLGIDSRPVVQISWCGETESARLDNQESIRLPSGRIQELLSSDGPLTIVIPEKDNELQLSIALRIAHDLHEYHRLDSEIQMDSEIVLSKLGRGNLIVVGDGKNLLTRLLLAKNLTEFGLNGGVLTFKGRGVGCGDRPGGGAMFLHPHPVSKQSQVLIMFGFDSKGLERLGRLFPVRTGIAIPDWIVVGDQADDVGAAGIINAGVWKRWRWNEHMSYFYQHGTLRRTVHFGI